MLVTTITDSLSSVEQRRRHILHIWEHLRQLASSNDRSRCSTSKASLVEALKFWLFGVWVQCVPVCACLSVNVPVCVCGTVRLRAHVCVCVCVCVCVSLSLSLYLSLSLSFFCCPCLSLSASVEDSVTPLWAHKSANSAWFGAKVVKGGFQKGGFGRHSPVPQFPPKSLFLQWCPGRRKLWFLKILDPKNRNEGTFAETDCPVASSWL